jgi:polyhydroxyalkanoate synthesis regulator phasin
MAEPASAFRALAEAVTLRLREEREQIGDRAGDTVSAVLRELGFVSRREYDELELRVAQLEHRLRLVEDGEAAAAPPSPPDAVP